MQQLSFKFLFLFVLGILQINSQNEFSKWYFGYKAGLDFSTSPPTVLTNGSLNNVEGCASISNAAGNILFYTDGITVYNSTHSVMANGTGLSSNGSATQAGIIVKQPGNSNIYYIFTVDAQAYGPGACYSIVDMNLAAGLGAVTVKNTTLYVPTCEKLAAVRHCNGRDAWIVSHEYNTSNFMAYLLTSTGLSTTPVISATGPLQGGTGMNAALGTMGQLKISPNGKKLAIASYCDTSSTNPGSEGIHLFDFDPSSGIVSNPFTLLNLKGAFGVEFSPDGSKLYGNNSPPSGLIALFQWDICAPTNSAIIASQYSLSLNNSFFAGSLQRANDGKIYLAVAGVQSLDVINNPNSPGAAMNFSFNAIGLGPNMCGYGLPNYINATSWLPATAFNHTVSCQNVNFAPLFPSTGTGCGATSYTSSGYLWDFGEPSSGLSNTSSAKNPSHSYASLGSYTVSLILYNQCNNDTIRKVIAINTPGPNPTISVTGVFNLCYGESKLFTAAGGNSYLWSNGTTTYSNVLSPTTTSSYFVVGTGTNGCSATTAFTVSVNNCVGVAKEDPSNSTSRIFPNPFDDLLFVEIKQDLAFIIRDLDGKVLLKKNLVAGTHSISTEILSPGLYLISAESSTGIWQKRMVKIK